MTAGATEVASKRRRTHISEDADTAAPAPVGRSNVTDGSCSDAGEDAEGDAPDTAWNAAQLQPGMTEVLVAPGFKATQYHAQPDSPKEGDTVEVFGQKAQAAASHTDATQSQSQELRLEAESSAAVADGAASLPEPLAQEEEEAQLEQSAGPETAEADQNTATGKETAVADAAAGVAAEQMAVEAADDVADAVAVAAANHGEDDEADDVELEVQSMLSDGTDSYQGLPAETLAHLAASANGDASDHRSRSAEADAAMNDDNAVLAGAEASGKEEDDQQHHHQQQDDNPEADLKAQATSDAETGQTGDALQELPQPADINTKAGADADSPSEQEEAVQGQAAVEDIILPKPAADAQSSAADVIKSAGSSAWPIGTEVEVHVSALAHAWCWKLGFLAHPFTPGISKEAPVKHQTLQPTVQPVYNLAAAAHVRPVPPSQSDNAMTGRLSRGDVLEVRGVQGNVVSFNCAVFVSMVHHLPGGPQNLLSIVHGLHTRNAGMQFVSTTACT